MSAIILSASLSSAIATTASGTVYTVDWLNYDPFVMNDFSSPQPTLPPGQTFFLPGVGNVRMDYTSPPFLNYSGFRGSNAALTSGSITSGPDSYSWADYEFFQRTNFEPRGTISSWAVTYTFLDGPVAAGELALGIWGLGRLDLDFPGNITTATVSQNGTYLGEWGVSSSLGPNQYSGGAGSFDLQNALPGDFTPGNPAFNTALAVVRIDDTISSLTVNLNQIGNDGIGVNIGRIIPAPGTAMLLGLGGLVAVRRRR